MGNHIRTLSVFLVLILLSSTPLAHAQRGVEVKSRDDLNHKSGKLGTYRALVIGIDKYRDPKIPSLKTAVNDARVQAATVKRPPAGSLHRCPKISEMNIALLNSSPFTIHHLPTL